MGRRKLLHETSENWQFGDRNKHLQELVCLIIVVYITSDRLSSQKNIKSLRIRFVKIYVGDIRNKQGDQLREHTT